MDKTSTRPVSGDASAKESEKSSGVLSSRFLYDFFHELAVMTVFAGRFFREVLKPRYEISETMKQCYLIGFKSLSLCGITGFIMGLVLTIQSRPTMAKFGAESMLPAMVGLSIIREIGPVLTALICAGKVGSGIGAELASMKVTEQIDAMEVSGINPFKYIVVTRIVSTSFMLPLLVVCTDAIGLLGAFAGVNIKDDVSFRLFFSKVFDSVDFIDMVPSLIKTVFFGFAIGLVACYKGYNSNKGTEGVGEAANASVVIASLLVFVIDMLAVQITDLFIVQ